MELIFNEQSVVPCADDLSAACSAVIQFIKTYKEAEKHEFRRIRYEKSFDRIELAPDFTLNDFCCNPKFRTYGGLLLGLARHPFIENDSPEESRFINNDFYIKRGDCEIQVEGLGITYLYKSIGISFCIDSFWEQIRHRLAFARRLCHSPYVVEIVNSIPYNPHESLFIRTVKDNGLIEIVLTNTDKGLGLVLQSTGRNMQETQEIAKILEEQYS